MIFIIPFAKQPMLTLPGWLIDRSLIEQKNNMSATHTIVFREAGACFPILGQFTEFSVSESILSNRALFEFNLPNVSRKTLKSKIYESCLLLSHLMSRFLSWIIGAWLKEKNIKLVFRTFHFGRK